MKAWTRLTVALTATAGFVLGHAVHAPALPTDVEFRFDAATPRPGASVTGDQVVAGVVEAVEGVTRIDLYVVAHRATGTAPTGAPVATQRERVARPDVAFTLRWNADKTAPGTVDLVVVATTTTRRAQAEVPNVVVVQPKPVVAPPRQPVTKRQPAAAPAAPAAARPGAAPAVQAPRPAPQSAPAPVAPAPEAPTSVVSAEQARAFYEVFGQLAFPADEAPAVAAPTSPRRAVVTETVPWHERINWGIVGVGLLLLAAAAFTGRLAYAGPESEPALA